MEAQKRGHDANDCHNVIVFLGQKARNVPCYHIADNSAAKRSQKREKQRADEICFLADGDDRTRDGEGKYANALQDQKYCIKHHILRKNSPRP